ncbi:uncharacterized protein [Anabrus simplex]|uniref:uncharacterized protein n=1 Tax=Anabrus simplex TaxID=316456 RepID=UPI0035A37729
MDTLKRLSYKYNCSVQELKKKIKNLRTAFHREHKRIQKVKTSGASPLRGKICFGYNLLTFLLDIDAPSKKILRQVSLGNVILNLFILLLYLQATMICYSLFKEETLETADLLRTATPDSAEISVDDPSNQILENMDNNQCPAEEIGLGNKNRGKCKKRKCNLQEERVEEAYSILKSSIMRDEFAVYGEYVANELRKVSPRVQVLAKHRINNILFEASIGNYDFQSPSCTRNFIDTLPSNNSSYGSPSTTSYSTLQSLAPVCSPEEHASGTKFHNHSATTLLTAKQISWNYFLHNLKVK